MLVHARCHIIDKMMKQKYSILLDDQDDNMRGWDPASEDDMPDNGIGRYSRNNDEKGWN